MSRLSKFFRIKPRTELEDQIYEAERARIHDLAAAEDHELQAAKHRLNAKHHDARIARIRGELAATEAE